MREFLIHFSRYGLIEKRQRGGWRLRALDVEFARELADMRDMLEMGAAQQFDTVPPQDPFWAHVASLAERHIAVLADDNRSFGDVRALDREFHTMLIEQLAYRFATTFYDIVSFIFHYHYQWNKLDEKGRSHVALSEHIDVLQALEQRDFARARESLRRHLNTSRSTLFRTIELSMEQNGQ